MATLVANIAAICVTD